MESVFVAYNEKKSQLALSESEICELVIPSVLPSSVLSVNNVVGREIKYKKIMEN